MPGSPKLLAVSNPVAAVSVQAEVAPITARQASTGLIGRRAECEALEQLIDSVRAGNSRVLVIHGEPGVGKTALLEYVGRRAAGCRVIRATGVESEMELPYAALHRFVQPLTWRST